MKTECFDVVEFLNSEEEIQAYLKEVLESGASMKAIHKAFNDAERARANVKHQEPKIDTVDMIFNALVNSKFTTFT